MAEVRESHELVLHRHRKNFEDASEQGVIFLPNAEISTGGYPPEAVVYALDVPQLVHWASVMSAASGADRVTLILDSYTDPDDEDEEGGFVDSEPGDGDYRRLEHRFAMGDPLVGKSLIIMIADKGNAIESYQLPYDRGRGAGPAKVEWGDADQRRMIGFRSWVRDYLGERVFRQPDDFEIGWLEAAQAVANMSPPTVEVLVRLECGELP